MAVSTKDTKRKYHTPGVVDGNLARRLDRHEPQRYEVERRELERRLERSGQLDFDRQYKQRRETEAERIARQRAKTKAAVRPAQQVSPLMVMGFVVVGGLLLCLLMCYVRINAISASIVEMKGEIRDLEAEQISLLTRHEQVFDLSAVKEAAVAAGMSQPSESQVYYIDLPGQDHVTVRRAGEQGSLARFMASVDRRAHEVLEYFR